MAEAIATSEIHVALQSFPPANDAIDSGRNVTPVYHAADSAREQMLNVPSMILHSNRPYLESIVQATQARESQITYIQSLLERLDHLKVVQAAAHLSDQRGQHTDINTHDQSPSLTPISSLICPAGGAVSFDRHFIIPSVMGSTSRFYGSSSVFSLTVEVLAQASSRGLYKPSPISDSPNTDGTNFKDFGGLHRHCSSNLFRRLVRSHLTLYIKSVGTLYPFVDESLLATDVEAFFEICARPHFAAINLQEDEAYQYFRIAMICAIASSSTSKHQPYLLASGIDFYSEALKLVEVVTSEVSFRSLQALLFLAVYCLFSPREGSAWKFLDFACRLSVQLGYHTEEHPQLQDERQKALRRSTFWTLYSMEHLLGQFLGRPSDLPEPIISTEYPKIPAISPLAGDTSQAAAVIHTFRLNDLRSKIYTRIYLSTNSSLPDFKWFLDYYSALQQWYQDAEQIKDDTGCGTVACNILLHSSVIFLFQRLILQALWLTRHDTATTTVVAAIPSETYKSACELIRIHDKIVRAPQGSELGTYPMTFLSAYSIWLAAMTLMAHCLLSINGRVETLVPLLDNHLPHRTQKIIYNDLFELSGTCLILLAWCAERWPGMEGMTDAYQRLSQKVLPLLVQKGLVQV